MINLEQTLRSSKGSNRWQIKYIIFGLGAILFFFVYLSSQVLLFSSLNLQLIPVISIVILISTVILGLSIVRHRLLDVDVFISRYIVYNSVTLFVVGIYLLLTGIVAQGIRYFNPSFSYFFSTLFVFVAILTLIILLFITKIRRKIQLFINRNFYKHKYEFRDKWMESIDRLASKSTNKEICRTLLAMVSETMAAKNIHLWLYNPVCKYFRIFDRDEPAEIKVIDKSSALIKEINLQMKPFFLEDVCENQDISEKEMGELDDLKRLTGSVICSPLIAGEEVLGFILQGEDISGEQYRIDDFEFLKAVTTQSAIQL
ncbi:MAG: hypothetical protein KAR20_01520, partial [Candidatus Heimdallarchaeota archaeon]|nr:hypothetical protein [Candidatus Heimdallarchaeota archaeon]